MYKSIVVGTDGSGTATKAVSEAISLAKASNAKLHVVTAFGDGALREVERDAETVPADVRVLLDPHEAIGARARHAADMARDEGVEATFYTRRDDPAHALLDVASENHADLIVVGNKGMHGSRRFLLGSVPNTVSHKAACSVLVVQTT